MSQAPGFRVFAIVVEGRFLNDDELESCLRELGLERAPVLYRGPFSTEKVAEFTTGKESVTGTEAHLREGIVITPQIEQTHPQLGRLALKSVSEAYLLRKGGTEYS